MGRQAHARPVIRLVIGAHGILTGPRRSPRVLLLLQRVLSPPPKAGIPSSQQCASLAGVFSPANDQVDCSFRFKPNRINQISTACRSEVDTMFFALRARLRTSVSSVDSSSTSLAQAVALGLSLIHI